MATWSEFARAAPALGAAIRGAFHQYGPGLAYLATIRPDGGPRLHPVSPVITDEVFYCCVLDTPKRGDLDRDGRYALHAYPSDDSDDEACVRGRARLVTDPVTVRRIGRQVRAMPDATWQLFEFDVETAFFVARPAGRRAAVMQAWHAPSPHAEQGATDGESEATRPKPDPTCAEPNALTAVPDPASAESESGGCAVESGLAG